MNKSEKKLAEPVKEKDQIRKKSSYTGKTPKQIMSKHIRDKNDVITEEDFKNLNISIDISNDVAHSVLEIPDDKERPKDEEKDHPVVTPWDVIS
jgi:hypothetical protein